MEESDNPVDIFLWANQVDEYKTDLDIELFLFNKNYTPFFMSFSSEIDLQFRSAFLYTILNEIALGVGTGLSVREFELSENENNVIYKTKLENVGRAETLIHLIEHERGDITQFSDAEHDFKKIKGIVAKFSSKDKAIEPFYVIKSISQGNVLQSAASLEIRDGKFNMFRAEVGLKLPADNQLLLIKNELFVLNASKLERLFGYNFKKQALADKKIEEINQHYKLSFAEGLDLQSLISDRTKLINKLQKVEIGEISQNQAVDYADKMELELMTDTDDSIIIMEAGDLEVFINLINEDYIKSPITGKRYEIKTKRLLDDSGEE